MPSAPSFLSCFEGEDDLFLSSRHSPASFYVNNEEYTTLWKCPKQQCEFLNQLDQRLCLQCESSYGNVEANRIVLKVHIARVFGYLPKLLKKAKKVDKDGNYIDEISSLPPMSSQLKPNPFTIKENQNDAPVSSSKRSSDASES